MFVHPSPGSYSRDHGKSGVPPSVAHTGHCPSQAATRAHGDSGALRTVTTGGHRLCWGTWPCANPVALSWLKACWNINCVNPVMVSTSWGSGDMSVERRRSGHLSCISRDNVRGYHGVAVYTHMCEQQVAVCIYCHLCM